jgi:hypothetical protein
MRLNFILCLSIASAAPQRGSGPRASVVAADSVKNVDGEEDEPPVHPDDDDEDDGKPGRHNHGDDDDDEGRDDESDGEDGDKDDSHRMEGHKHNPSHMHKRGAHINDAEEGEDEDGDGSHHKSGIHHVDKPVSHSHAHEKDPHIEKGDDDGDEDEEVATHSDRPVEEEPIVSRQLERRHHDDDEDSPSHSSHGMDRISAYDVIGQLFGLSVGEYLNSDPNTGEMMDIDCSTNEFDDDHHVTIVTTLCPFLRGDSPCGLVRHPSYVFESSKKLCSNDCLPHINSVINGMTNREKIKESKERTIFRDIGNHIIQQYCHECRDGCSAP